MRKTVHLTLAVLAVGLATPALADDDDAQKLAHGLRAALDQMNVAKS
jgi:hypothetical protein